MPHQDSYLWLESCDSPQVAQWTAEQNACTAQELDSDPRFAPLRDAILRNMQDTRQIPLFSVHDDVLYNFHQDAAQPRGVYRATTLDQYTQAETRWQTLLDVDALAEHEGYDWYLAGVDHCTLLPTRCLVSLNIGGSDACVIREYDLATQSFVSDGFAFPYGKSQVSWRDADSVFVCPAWDEDQITSAGYSREVVLLERGQAWEDAASMMVLPEQILKVAAWRFLDVSLDAASGGGVVPFDLIEVAQDFYRRSYFYLNSLEGGEAEPQHLPLPTRCVIEAYSHGDLLIRLDAAWQYAGETFPAGSLIALACDASSGELGRAQLLFAPDMTQAGFATQSLQMLEATLNGLLIVILDNVTSRVISMHRHEGGSGGQGEKGGEWQQHSNPIHTGGVIEIVAQPWRSDTLYYLYSDFLTPASLYRHELGSINPPQLLRAQPAAFDATDLQVQQYHARSKDGTTIPYFLVCNKAIVLDGNTPVLMYGYGGFAVPLLPYYLDNLGEHWLKQGGAYVVANIRGGGEFGPAWHEGGRGKNRQNSFDDFIAIAEDLITRDITKPVKLAIQGGSNGGLLVAACMIQRPELFGAVVCEVPLLDMLRFDELGAGASWIAEYGKPNAEYLGVYSPYQNVKSATEQHYPRVLLTTSSEDDRVHPAHARKMAAKLQELGHDALFFESQSGGHSGQTQQQHTAEELARVLVFLYKQIGEE